MKENSWLQLLLALLIGAMLSTLFILSRFDESMHTAIMGHLLRLQQLEARQDLVVNRLAAGKQHSFDTLGEIGKQLDDHLGALDSFWAEADKGIRLAVLERQASVSNALRQKHALIARFKRGVAASQFTRHYFPTLAREVLDLVGNDAGQSAGHGELERSLARLVTETLLQVDGRSGGNTPLPALRAGILELVSTTGTLRAKEIRLLLRYSGMLAAAGSRMNAEMARIGELGTASLLQELTNAFVAVEDRKRASAESFRTWLFVAALILLAYLSHIFVRLQHTSHSLSRSLQHLKFQKFALDQHAIVSITDVTGRIVYANDRFCAISKYERSELIGANHRIIKSNQHDDDFYRNIWRTIAAGRVWQGIICNRAKDGSLYWLDSTLVPRLGADGKPYEYIGIRTDITQQVQAERDVEILARFPQENPDPVMRLTASGVLLYANPASEVILKHWRLSHEGRVPEDWLPTLLRAHESGLPEEQELTVGDRIYLLNISPIREAGYINLYARDITEKQKAEEELSYQATHDQLTGLRNRFSFESALRHAIEACHIDGRQGVFLYLDLDQFKIVNDTCGHVAGDELLRQLSGLVRGETREDDVLARLGGDEFGLILNHCPLEKGREIAHKLLEIIRDYRFAWEDKSFDVGASIGVVPITAHWQSMVELLSAADMACYAAKEQGRNRVVVYEDDAEDTGLRLAEMHWAAEIPQALAENRFVLFAQTITPLQDPAENGHHEILVRMLGREGEVIPPGAFIPAAERYNMMSTIDHWVIRNLVAFIVEARDAGTDTSKWQFAVNLSGDTLNRPEMIDFISDQIRDHDIEPGLLSFEVTETAAIANLSSAVDFIRRLRALGCRFALDDFGSGLSSFAYLKNLPVDYLKIDGAFVRDILVDPIDASMVEAINRIGHVMQIRTIAEFAENEDIVERLRDIGVDYAQGYGVHRPAPLQQVILGRDQTGDRQSGAGAA